MKITHVLKMSKNIKDILDKAVKDFKISDDTKIYADILMYQNPAFTVSIKPMDINVFTEYALLRFFKVFKQGRLNYKTLIKEYQEFNQIRDKNNLESVELTIDENHLDELDDIQKYFRENKYIIDKDVFIQYIISWYIEDLGIKYKIYA